MNALDFLRYIKGYVTFKGEGGFTERFINLCNICKVSVRDLSYTDSSFTAKCSVSDYKKLRHIGKKSGVRLSLLKRQGLIFDLKEKSERKGLLFGAVFFLVFFAVMSRFVWSVDVTGNVLVPKEDILKLGKSYGIFVGTYKPHFDEVTIANTMAMESDGVFSWAAINIKGSRAVIEVREQKKSIKDNEIRKPCNIIADFDGVIISAEVLSGTSFIREGMGIREGDLLISGAEENEDMSASFVEARGRITVERDKSFTLSFNKNGRVNRISEADESLSIYLFGLRIPLTLSTKKNKLFFTDEVYLSYNGVRLPIGIISKTYYKTAKVTRNEKQLILSALETFSESSYELNKNTRLLSADPYVNVERDRIIASCRWNCLDFAGKKQEIITES